MARAVERQVQLGNYERVRAMWPWPRPVRVSVQTVNAVATAVLMQMWMLDSEGHRAVVGGRRLGLGGLARCVWLGFVFLVGEVVLVVGLALLGLTIGWAAPALILGAVFVLGLPMLRATAQEAGRGKALRRARRAVRRAAPGPVYEASSLASTGGWAGLRLMRLAAKMADDRNATVVLKTIGRGRRRLYAAGDFSEIASVTLASGECVLMVRWPKGFTPPTHPRRDVTAGGRPPASPTRGPAPEPT